jgi:hypothetical protein
MELLVARSSDGLGMGFRRLMKKLAILVLAVIGRVLIGFLVPERLPYITFFPAVFLAAYYLGPGPGLLVHPLDSVSLQRRLIILAFCGTTGCLATCPLRRLHRLILCRA